MGRKRKTGLSGVKARQVVSDEVGLGPTPERRRQADFAPEALTPDGRTVALRQVDSLATLQRSGTITPLQAKAGRLFRSDWEALNRAMGAPAIDLGKVRVDGGGAGWTPEPCHAGGRAWVALGRLGGVHAPAGACLVKVVGEGMSLRGFARLEGWPGRKLSHETASGLLLAALGALVSFYRLDPEETGKAR